MSDYTYYLDKLLGAEEKEESVWDSVVAFQGFLSKLLRSINVDSPYRGEVLGVGTMAMAILKLLTLHPRSLSFLPKLELAIKGVSFLMGMGVFGPLFAIFSLSSFLVWAKSFKLGVFIPPLVGIILGSTSLFDTPTSDSKGNGWSWKNFALIALSAFALFIIILW